MNDMPLVTIAVATYNRAETLKYAVESILSQTYQNFELWIVGDKCTDHTESILQPYLVDPRVNWYNLPENSGYQSIPNNEAIKRGNGKYIAYLNHDDIWLPNHLADCVAHIEKSGADFVYSILQWVFSFTVSRADIPVMPTMPLPPEATVILHKREVIDKIGYWKDINETFAYPRVEFIRRAYRNNMKFEIVPSLTALKFLWDEESYHDKGPQEIYLRRIKEEPDFINKELSAIVIRAYQELGRPITLKRLKRQYADKFRGMMIQLNLDPARLKFWQKKGTRIRIWRKRHHLD